MNKDQIKGKIEKIKGEVKEKIGGAVKDRSTQAEGFVERAKGKVREELGDLREDLEHGHDPTKRGEPEEP